MVYVVRLYYKTINAAKRKAQILCGTYYWNYDSNLSFPPVYTISKCLPVRIRHGFLYATVESC